MSGKEQRRFGFISTNAVSKTQFNMNEILSFLLFFLQEYLENIYNTTKKRCLGTYAC